MQPGTLLAAIDLGSNSFRLEIGQFNGERIHRSAYHKDIVRQGKGLDADLNLTPGALQRGWDCLARFGEHLAGFDPRHVRAVATQTLRDARNRAVFLQRGQLLLGHPIEVISGHEEARLIYQGVVSLLPASSERRLVVDIGGRSTELVLGQGHAAHTEGSFHVGSVAWSMRFFGDGRFTPSAFAEAEAAARTVLADAAGTYPPSTWAVAYGASGTVGAVADALTGAGWPKDLITPKGLDWLLGHLLAAGSIEQLHLEGVKDDRKAVIGGGLSIMRALFDVFSIQQMQAAEGALRHGLLYGFLPRRD